MAEATGNMTLRPNSVVHEVMYDADNKRATGVRVIDAETKEVFEFKAKVIFLCASAVASTSILMQSKSEHFPNGMGNESGELGHNLMDHHFQVGAQGRVEGFEDNTGEVVTEEVPAMATRIKKLLARKKNLQRQRKNFLPKTLK